MEYWDFLLQKEGDRSWLPLEAPDVEILEGRYRVVARSSRAETPVEIRVTHAGMSDSPKRRVQMRSGQTNREGLLVVMPFTQLQPGTWELRCRGDLMADMLGNSWQSAVQLQVVSQEAEWQSDWEASAPEASPIVSEIVSDRAVPLAVAQTPFSIAASIEPSEPLAAEWVAELVEDAPIEPESAGAHSPQPAIPESSGSLSSSSSSASDPGFSAPVAEVPVEARSVPFEIMAPTIEVAAATASPSLAVPDQFPDSLLESIFVDLDEALNEVTDRQEPIEPLTAATACSYRIVLEQDAYGVQRGQTLVFRGQIDAAATAPLAFAGEIKLQLRDPQRSIVVAEVRQLLPQQKSATGLCPPLSFDCTVTIPADYQAHLLLGEVVLLVAGEPIATHAFTVTIDLDELLSIVAEPSNLVQPPLAFGGETANDLNLAFLDLLAQPTPSLQFQPSLQQALPPQLYQPHPDRPLKPIQLPFAESIRQAEAPSAAGQAVEESKEALPELTDPIDEGMPEIEPAIRTSADEIAVPPIARTTAEVLPLAAPAAIDSPDLPLEWQTASDLMRLQPGHLARPAHKEDAAFRSLNLKQRFWSRLNSLAGDEELSTWLQTSTPNAPKGTRQPSGLDADLAAQEFVVEAEMPVPKRDRARQLEEPPASLVLPKDESIPTPQLDLPLGELTAGKSITVKVKLPNLAPRIYVKLWLRDRQNWILLDGPRWLVNFTPNGRGSLEAYLPITVPFGCLEVQFEAIAVEMATQRESQKVTLDRLVVPPNLPTLSLEELDV